MLGGAGTSREALEGWARKRGGGRVEFFQSQCPLFTRLLSRGCPESPVLNHCPQGEGSPL